MSSQNIPEVPLDLAQDLYDFCEAVRNFIINQQVGSAPRPPSNLIVTPVALGNQIQFTRSDAVDYLIYVSDSPNLSAAQVIPIGNIAYYTHYVGQSGVTKFYWAAAKAGDFISEVIGPVSGTTLAAGAVATIPNAPPATDNPADTVDGRNTGNSGYQGA